MCTENLTMRCGFGKQEITPPEGHGIAGYFAPRYVKGVIDPLFARVAMFDNGKEKSMIIALDTIYLDQGIGYDIRNQVAAELGMDVNAILINCSHTHTGPNVSTGEKDAEYIAFLKKQAVAAAIDASKDLTEARLFYAKTEAKDISFIRRYKLKDGSVKTNPGKFVDMLDHPIGKANEGLYLLKIVRNGADDIYMFCFGTHADTTSGELISADWPGFACSILERAIPGSKAMFVLGPEGDVNHYNFMAPNRGMPKKDHITDPIEKQTAHARYMGRVIAGNILAVCDKATEISGNDISFAMQKVELATNRPEVTEEMTAEAQKVMDTYNEWVANPGDRPRPTTVKSVLAARRVLNAPNLPESEDFGVYAMKLGDFVIATLPGEPFTQLGDRIYAGAGYDKMMVFCNTNGTCGYIPTKDCFDDGGYESNSSRFMMGSDDRLVEGAIAAAKVL